MNPARHSTRAASRRRILPWLALIAPACFVLLWGVGWLLAPPPAQPDALATITRLQRSIQPEGENAWPIYRAILRDHFGHTSMETKGSDLSLLLAQPLSELPGAEAYAGDDMPEMWLIDLRLGAWDDPRTAHARALLDRFEPVIADLDRAAQAPAFFGSLSIEPGVALWDDAEPPTDALDILLPHLSHMRRLAQLNALFLRRAAAAGDWDGVAQRVRTGVAIANHQAQEPFIISQLVSGHTLSLIAEEVRLTLLEREPPLKVCDAMLGALETRRPRTLEQELTMLDLERQGSQAYLRRLYRGFGDDLSQEPSLSEALEARLSLPPPRLAAHRLDRHYDRLKDWWRDPDAFPNGPPTIPGRLGRSVSDIARVRNQLEHADAAFARTTLLLKIRRFELAHGRAPTADELGLTADDLAEMAALGEAFPPGPGEPRLDFPAPAPPPPDPFAE